MASAIRTIPGASPAKIRIPSRSPGMDIVDYLAGPEKWVENGVAPENLMASHSTDGEIDMTRPLYLYPKVAAWDGVSDPNEDANFICQDPIVP